MEISTSKCNERITDKRIYIVLILRALHAMRSLYMNIFYNETPQHFECLYYHVCLSAFRVLFIGLISCYGLCGDYKLRHWISAVNIGMKLTDRHRGNQNLNTKNLFQKHGTFIICCCCFCYYFFLNFHWFYKVYFLFLKKMISFFLSIAFEKIVLFLFKSPAFRLSQIDRKAIIWFCMVKIFWIYFQIMQ